jgi:hypothetical protein
MSDSVVCAFDLGHIASLASAAEIFDDSLQESDRVAVAHGMVDAIRRFVFKLFKLGDASTAIKVLSLTCTTATRDGGAVEALAEFSTTFRNPRICVQDLRTQLAEPQEHVELLPSSISGNGTGTFFWQARMYVTLDIARAILVKKRIPAVTPPQENDHERILAQQHEELLEEEREEKRRQTVEVLRQAVPKRRRVAQTISTRVQPKRNKAPENKPEPSPGLLQRIARYIFAHKPVQTAPTTNYVEAYKGDESLFLF